MLTYDEASPEGEATNNKHQNYSPVRVAFPHWPMHFLSADNLAKFQKVLCNGNIKVELPNSFWTLRFLIGLAEANDVEGKKQISCYKGRSVTFTLSTREIINWIYCDNSSAKSKIFKSRLNRFESIRKILKKTDLPFKEAIDMQRSVSYRNASFVITLHPSFFELMKGFQKKTDEDGIRIMNSDLKLLEDFSSSEQAFKFIICSIFYIQKNNLERIDLITRSIINIAMRAKHTTSLDIKKNIKDEYQSSNKYPNKPLAIEMKKAATNPLQTLWDLLNMALTVNSSKSFNLSKNALRHVNSFIVERINFLRNVDDDYKNGVVAFLSKLVKVFDSSFFDEISDKISPFEMRLNFSIDKQKNKAQEIPANSFNSVPQAAQPKERFTAQAQ